MTIEVKMTKDQIDNLATIVDTFSSINEVELIKEDDGKIYIKLLLPGDGTVADNGNDK